MEWDALVEELADALADALTLRVREKLAQSLLGGRTHPEQKTGAAKPRTRRAVTAADVAEMPRGIPFFMGQDAIVTPLAAELARDAGITLVREENR